MSQIKHLCLADHVLPEAFWGATGHAMTVL